MALLHGRGQWPLRSWAGLAASLRAGERQLTDSPGEEYEQFAAGRKPLVPGVW